MIKLVHKFEDIISVDNLLLAWQEFVRGKRNRKDVQEFSFYLMDNILSSKNNTKTCWVLRCDIKKFFASVDQATLIKILQKQVNDENIINLLKEIIASFKPNGLPLGNLTSQLFANIYLNELDQFVKHKLKIQDY